GDLYVIMKIQPHRLFRLDGRDIYYDLYLSPPEAVLGAQIEIPTLGNAVEMTIPAGTTAGKKLRLSGRGLAAGGSKNGDLYVVTHIDVPQNPTEKERKLYEELAAESGFDPRAKRR